MLEIKDYKKEVEHIIDSIRTYFMMDENLNAKAVIGISGGKDSTIAATLLVKAIGVDNVICVKMPQGEQSDIDYSNKVIDFLGIPKQNIYEINIGDIVTSSISVLHKNDIDTGNPVLYTNLPARIRMTTLYAVAATRHGRVINTCNYSEDYVGYSTKYGDNAGDFAILQSYTVKEILKIGEELGVPRLLIYKTPADGLCGKTDEDNLGFTYAELDEYILHSTEPKNFDKLRKMKELHNRSFHKNIIEMPKVRRTENFIYLNSDIITTAKESITIKNK